MKKATFVSLALASALLAAAAPAVRAQEKAGAGKPAAMHDTAAKDLGTWLRQARQKLMRQEDLTSKDFDRLFSDEYFRGSQDPLADINRLNARLDADIEAEKSRFKKAYDKWFSERMDMVDLSPSVQETPENVTVTFKKPAAAPGSKFKVDVNKNRIKVDYQSRSAETEKKAGETLKSSSYQHNEKIMSIPPNADPYRYKVEDLKDTLTIVFGKKK